MIITSPSAILKPLSFIREFEKDRVPIGGAVLSMGGMAFLKKFISILSEKGFYGKIAVS